MKFRIDYTLVFFLIILTPLFFILFFEINFFFAKRLFIYLLLYLAKNAKRIIILWRLNLHNN